MKPAAFDFVRATSIAEATRLLAEANGAARLIAGAQSLGPMLNLRLAQPRLLIDITGIPELTRIEDDDETVTIGACVTTANIEDGRLPGRGLDMLSTVAAQIAYRAVRNRGTIGGSLCHADPAADWVIDTLRAWRGVHDRWLQWKTPHLRRSVRYRGLRERPWAGRNAGSDPRTATVGAWSLRLLQSLPQGRRIRIGDRRSFERSAIAGNSAW